MKRKLSTVNFPMANRSLSYYNFLRRLLITDFDTLSLYFTFFFQNGVRGLMLDLYDFENDVWLCHSFGGQCFNYTAFVSDKLFICNLVMMNLLQ